MHKETETSTRSSTTSPPEDRFAEDFFGAVFFHQKMRLYAEARTLILGPDFDRWRFNLPNDQEDEYAIDDWILTSQNNPPAMLAKTILNQAVIHSSDPSDLAVLQHYALDLLSSLQESTMARAHQKADIHGANAIRSSVYAKRQ